MPASLALAAICRAEKAVFQNVLGPNVRIERDEHIVGGGRRCTYLVREGA